MKWEYQIMRLPYSSTEIQVQYHEKQPNPQKKTKFDSLSKYALRIYFKDN